MFPGWLQDFFRMIISNERSKGTGWSPAIRWSPAIGWSIGSMDFDNPKVYGDTFISDGLVFYLYSVKFLWTIWLKMTKNESQICMRRRLEFSKITAPTLYWSTIFGAKNYCIYSHLLFRNKTAQMVWYGIKPIVPCFSHFIVYFNICTESYRVSAKFTKLSTWITQEVHEFHIVFRKNYDTRNFFLPPPVLTNLMYGQKLHEPKCLSARCPMAPRLASDFAFIKPLSLLEFQIVFCRNILSFNSCPAHVSKHKFVIL